MTGSEKGKWTPGPWRWAKEPEVAGCPEVYGGDEYPVAMVRSAYRTRDEQHANARLLAAAPELVEALRELVGLLKVLPPITFAQVNEYRAHDALGLNPYAMNEGLATAETLVHLSDNSKVWRAESLLSSLSGEAGVKNG